MDTSNHLLDGDWTVWLRDSVPVTTFSFSGPEGKDRSLPPFRSIQSIRALIEMHGSMIFDRDSQIGES